MEKVYISGNVTCLTMTNGKTLYNTCEVDTRWAHGDDDSIWLVQQMERNRWRPDVKPDSFQSFPQSAAEGRLV